MKFVIKEPVFYSELHVFVGVNYEKVLAYMKKNWGLTTEDELNLMIGPSTDAQINLFKSNRVGVVWFRKPASKSPEFIGDVTHEMVHWGLNLMNKIGAKHIDDEPICYLIQYYTEQIFANIERIVRNERKKKNRSKISKPVGRNRKRPVRNKSSLTRCK